MDQTIFQDNIESKSVRDHRKAAVAYDEMHILDATNYACWLVGEPIQSSESDSRLTFIAYLHVTENKGSVEQMHVEELRNSVSSLNWSEWKTPTEETAQSQLDDDCVDFVWAALGTMDDELDQRVRRLEAIHRSLQAKFAKSKNSLNFSIGRHPYSAYCGIVNSDAGTFAADRFVVGPITDVASY